jgi:subtilisin-like proprotein convertase family protein
MRKLLFVLSLIACTAFVSVTAQEISIAANDSYTSCLGAVVDSGLSAADYGANENETITWCPEAPETVLNFYWVVFDLDAASTITLYDGDDNTAPVIGTYSGDDLQGQDVFSGEDNVTGCITVEFTSGPGSSGNFGAYASCGFPCDRPFAIVNPAELQPHYACLNEPVYLEATSSTVADGQELVSWVWDLGDGNIDDNTSGPILEHMYTSPGLYTMNLSLTDDNDCSNNNLIDYQILVSTNPDFSGTSSDVTMCVGDEIDLTGAVVGVLYNAEPSVDFGGGLFIPDDQSGCFSSQLTFTSFNPGAVVNDANVDIINSFINFEHSYMGDITITFICPSGQSILVHQQGGNGTYLGVPIDNDADLTPGVGWDYYWEPGATNGTWVDNAGGTLPSGAYESIQPFTNLNGCPLNGTWEIEVCDLFASDNGFIFDWSIEFAPELYPEAISFTPTFGPECDSTLWDGPAIIDDGGDCNVVTISPDIGVQSYTYRAQNDFGCYYERTLDVNVVGVIPSITTNQTQFCGSPVTLMANVGDVDADDCDFDWTPPSFLDDASIQSPTINLLENTEVFTVTVSYATSGLTCRSQASIEIETCEIKIPNVFSPDNLNTGGNNTWRVDGLEAFDGVNCYIYNRWGTLVYTNIDFGNSGGWDPGIDGAEVGVYYYVLEIPCNEGDELILEEALLYDSDGYPIQVECNNIDDLNCVDGLLFNVDGDPIWRYINVQTEFSCDGMVPFTGMINLFR